LVYIDPDGRERIVVTGGEYNDAERYKYNFIETSINQLKQYVNEGGSDPITWAVMSAGYSNEDMKKFQAIANDLGIGFQSIGSANQLTNYINSKGTSSNDLSLARFDDQITKMSIFGHGLRGSAEFGYAQGSSVQGQFSWNMSDAADLTVLAFAKKADICFYTCNAATPVSGSNTANSLIGQMAEPSRFSVSGYWGRTDYATMNQGQGIGAKLNRNINGFNTNGSIGLPSPGRKLNGDPASLIRLGPK